MKERLLELSLLILLVAAAFLGCGGSSGGGSSSSSRDSSSYSSSSTSSSNSSSSQSYLKPTKFPCTGDRVKTTITSAEECKKLCRNSEKYSSGSGYYYKDYCFDEENEECYCR